MLARSSIALALVAAFAYSLGNASLYGQTASTKRYYISPEGNDANDGRSLQSPFRSIQKAIDLAQAGDAIELAPGTYRDDVVSRRDGTPDAPITISGPPDAVVVGNRSWTVFQIKHDYITLQGFTVDGLYGPQDSREGYRNKLLYAMSERPLKGVTGMRIIKMAFRNTGAECLRIRYFAEKIEIAESTFQTCGIWDFRFRPGGHNGEAVYIGTHLDQLGMFGAPTNDPDRSRNNWIHHNTFSTQGAECVDIKHHSTGNVVEYNRCTGVKHSDYPGISVLGDANVIRHNEIFGNVGAGIRLGGDFASVEYGRSNDVYGNVIRSNRAGGIQFMGRSQGKVCENTMQDNGGGDAVGRYATQFRPTARCN